VEGAIGAAGVAPSRTRCVLGRRRDPRSRSRRKRTGPGPRPGRAEARRHDADRGASAEELPWARDLGCTDCSHLKGQPPPDPPITPCDHLYGLFRRVQPRFRGLVEPEVATLEDGAARVLAVVAENRGAPYTALEWQVKPR